MILDQDKKKLFIITTDYFHSTRFRLHYLLPYLRKNFKIKVVAITHLTYDLDLDVRGKITSLKTITFVLKKFLYMLTRVIEYKDEELVIIRMPFPRLTLGWLYLILTAFVAAFLVRIKKMYEGFDACLATPNFAGLCALLLKMPLPIVYEDVDRCEYLHKDFLARKISRFVERYCIRNSDQVVSAGYALAESAETLRGMSVHCVPNGIDIRLFENSLSEKSTLSKGNASLVYVGYIAEWSGLDVVIMALRLVSSEFPNTKLIIAGKGEFASELKNLAREIHIDDKVTFLGRVKHKRIPHLLFNSGIGLAVYPDNELMRYAFTYKLLEYIAAGLPVIATDVGDTGKIVKKGQCGLIVEYSPVAIAEAIRKLLNNRDLMTRLTRNGRNLAKKFDLECLAQKEMEIILRTIKKHHKTTTPL